MIIYRRLCMDGNQLRRSCGTTKVMGQMLYFAASACLPSLQKQSSVREDPRSRIHMRPVEYQPEPVGCPEMQHALFSFHGRLVCHCTGAEGTLPVASKIIA